jgi:hypothetical protein
MRDTANIVLPVKSKDIFIEALRIMSLKTYINTLKETFYKMPILLRHIFKGTIYNIF